MSIYNNILVDAFDGLDRADWDMVIVKLNDLYCGVKALRVINFFCNDVISIFYFSNVVL